MIIRMNNIRFMASYFELSKTCFFQANNGFFHNKRFGVNP
jgi:hypothetical protein